MQRVKKLKFGKLVLSEKFKEGECEGVYISRTKFYVNAKAWVKIRIGREESADL